MTEQQQRPTGPSPAAGESAALDFYRLRREGIGRIETTASATWTDYNLHDPGITILEAAAYAQTELAFRTDFPIADILTLKGVPFVFHSGHARGEDLAERYPGAGVLSKPAPSARLVGALARRAA